MGTAIILLVLSTGLVMSLAITLLVEEFLLKGFFHVVYARQSRRPQP